MVRGKPKATKKSRQLSRTLRDLSKTRPKTAWHLSQAQSNREERLSRYFESVRLRGYEELIQHLEELEPVFQNSRKLRPISFLIGRARGDFQTALEAALSGFHSVAFDAMRDVMEIEFLLREFYFEPGHIGQWISCSNQERNNKFRPAVLRQRHAHRLGKSPQDLEEATDYRGHSTFLHVSPYQNPFGSPGLSESSTGFAVDSCFWEIFEHGRRLLFGAHKLRRKLARHIKSPWGPERGLKEFRDAWERTRETEMIFRALLEVLQDEQNGDAVENALPDK